MLKNEYMCILALNGPDPEDDLLYGEIRGLICCSGISKPRCLCSKLMAILDTYCFTDLKQKVSLHLAGQKVGWGFLFL